MKSTTSKRKNSRTDVKVTFRREGEIIPEGISVNYPSSSYRHWVYIQHYPNRLVIKIPKNDPKNYTIEEENAFADRK